MTRCSVISGAGVDGSRKTDFKKPSECGEERIKKFTGVLAHIQNICGEISGSNQQGGKGGSILLKKFEEFQDHLQELQKEKSQRLNKVFEDVSIVHDICAVLGIDISAKHLVFLTSAYRLINPTMSRKLEGSKLNPRFFGSINCHNPQIRLSSFRHLAKLDNSSFILGLKQILSENDISARILRSTYPEAVEMVRATIIEYPQKLHAKLRTSFKKSSSNSMPMDYTLLQVVREYGDKIELMESDGKTRTSKEKGKRKSKER
ncbi:65-kDa microtubule-associated protein 1-like protein [Tanacetum coccineum]